MGGANASATANLDALRVSVGVPGVPAGCAGKPRRRVTLHEGQAALAVWKAQVERLKQEAALCQRERTSKR